MENAELSQEKRNAKPLNYESRLVLQADQQDLKQDILILRINCSHFPRLLLPDSLSHIIQAIILSRIICEDYCISTLKILLI